jgi:carbamoyl-phosphate synthase large subunit
VKKIANIKGLRGPIDIDVFVSEKNEVFVNEINPRFGGGHPHAYGCGVNFMQLILNNLQGVKNEPTFHNYKEGILMLKYNGLLFRDTNA